jgi:hypothetical protein
MTIRIAFAGDFHWQAGSSHMIAEYARAADTVGCQVAVSTQLSRLDGSVDAHLPLVDDLTWASHLVLVFEGRQFLDTRGRDLCEAFPRHRRIVLDPDAHWGQPVTCGADDSAGPLGHHAWQELYRELGEIVLQPRLGPLPPGAQFFSYFGMPDPVPAPGAPLYDLQYVGANWWRWQQWTELVRAARPELSRLRVCGRWWEGPPHPDHLAATTNRPGWLRRHGVEVCPPVPFGQVVATMAQSVLTPVLARPLLAGQHLLTPRMFETLAADTLPVLPTDLAYTSGLYGDGIAPFVLGEDPAEDLARLHRDADTYRPRAAALRADLYRRFNYRRVLAQLLALLP